MAKIPDFAVRVEDHPTGFGFRGDGTRYQFTTVITHVQHQVQAELIDFSQRHLGSRTRQQCHPKSITLHERHGRTGNNEPIWRDPASRRWHEHADCIMPMNLTHQEVSGTWVDWICADLTADFIKADLRLIISVLLRGVRVTPRMQWLVVRARWPTLHYLVSLLCHKFSKFET